MYYVTKIIDLCNIIEACNRKYLYNGFNNILSEIDTHTEKLLTDSCSVYYNNCTLKIHSNIDHKVLEWKSNNMLTHVIISITEKCNMRCKYCVYHDTRYALGNFLYDININTLRRSLDFILEHSKFANETIVSFYGGEALLRFDLIRYAILYIDKNNYYGHCFRFIVSTNGILLNSDTVDFLVSRNIRCIISLDGPKTVHDRYRVDSEGNTTFNTIIRNIRRLANKYPDYYRKYVHFNTVFSPPYDYSIIYDFFSKSKVTYMDVDIGDYFKSYLLEKYGSLDFYFEDDLVDISNYLSGKEYLVYLKKFMAIEEVTDPKTVFPPSFCIPLERKMHINVSGKIMLCERVDECNTLFQLGDVFSGYDYKKVRKLFEFTNGILDNNCNKCWSFRFCNICFADLDKVAYDGDYCVNMRAKIEKDFKIFLELKHNNNRFEEIMQAISID